jgi:hypothetical protein
MREAAVLKLQKEIDKQANENALKELRENDEIPSWL